MKIPCENCITLPICKSEVLEKYRNDEFLTAGFLCSKCKIFERHTNQALSEDGTYEIYVMMVLSFFRGLENDTTCRNNNPV